MRHGLAIGLKRKGGLGFIPRKLTPEEKFLLTLKLFGKNIYDIGACEGVFTIFFARAAGEGKVVAFEPRVDNYSKIQFNAKINGLDNIKVFQVALADRQGIKTFTYQNSNPGTGSVQDDVKTQIIKKKYTNDIQVEVDSLDHQISMHNLPIPDFVKIDVEGYEIKVLMGMEKTIKDYKPLLFIEIHGVEKQNKIENAQKIVEFLSKNSYSFYHVESGEIITSSNIQVARSGHLFCTR